MLTYVLFFVGFVLLIYGADFLVDGASSLAKKNNIPELVIGLTIVAFGTSMPELVVNILASIDGNTEIAIGNIFGSNIANVLLILGISAMIKPLVIQRSIYYTEIPILLVATFMVGFLANANLFLPDAEGLTISRYDGIVLLFFFGLFMTYIFVISGGRDQPNDIPLPVQNTSTTASTTAVFSNTKSILYILGGITTLFIGGKFVVDGATEIALFFGLSETFIGLTIVAVGTSLPELMTSAVAAKKGNSDMAVGNVIGSNIFNILWILGVSALINPLPFEVASNTDILVMIVSSTLLIFAVIVGKGRIIDRWEGFLFIMIYIAYVVYLVLRG